MSSKDQRGSIRKIEHDQDAEPRRCIQAGVYPSYLYDSTEKVRLCAILRGQANNWELSKLLVLTRTQSRVRNWRGRLQLLDFGNIKFDFPVRA
jgi:hypothetical protein